MSKRSVYEYLKNNKGWHTTDEISKALGIRYETAIQNVRRLRFDGEIDFCTKPSKQGNYTYFYKIK